MFAEFDKYKEVFLSPSLVFPPSFVRRQLLTNHYYLPLLANELNKQTNGRQNLRQWEQFAACLQSLQLRQPWTSQRSNQLAMIKSERLTRATSKMNPEYCLQKLKKNHRKNYECASESLLIVIRHKLLVTVAWNVKEIKRVIIMNLTFSVSYFLHLVNNVDISCNCEQ